MAGKDDTAEVPIPTVQATTIQNISFEQAAAMPVWNQLFWRLQPVSLLSGVLSNTGSRPDTLATGIPVTRRCV